MIPASYLYKQVYKQHWGEDFVRRTGEAPGEAPWEARPEAGLWSNPSLWRHLGAFIGGVFGTTRATYRERDVGATLRRSHH